MATYMSLHQGPISHNETKFQPFATSTTLGQAGRPDATISIGKPSPKTLFSWKDIALLTTTHACFGVAVASVFSQRAAVYLGQTNQLVIVGFCLAVMALACQRQVSHAFLLYIMQSGTESLQDVEAVLRGDMLIARSSARSRCALLLLMALPLTLSVAYKRFVGGTSAIMIDGRSGQFGLSSPPGYQRIGLGLSHISEVYLPFWIDPQISKTYSYNLLIQTNQTSAVLDMPRPEYINSIQESLPEDESVLIMTVVNATVAENVPIPVSLRENETHWDEVLAQYGGNQATINLIGGHYAFVASGHSATLEGYAFNYTTNFISIYHEDQGQTQTSKMQQVEVTRRECRATWRVTSSNITLIDGKILESSLEAISRHNQSLVDNNDMGIVPLYGVFVAEFDWTRHPRVRPVSPVPALVATMLWARLTTQCGFEEPGSWYWWREINHYFKTGAEVETYRERATLHRSGLLLFVLAILPALSLCGAAVNIWLYRCPINDGFGMISILAAINPGSLGILRGAGMSGTLSRQIDAHFVIVPCVEEKASQRVEIRLDESGIASRVQRNTIYA